MYKKLKDSTIKSAMRSIVWPKDLIQLPRYSTLKTGAIIFLALIENSRGISILELMKLTGKSRRTVNRIIVIWEELGIPIYTEWNGEHNLIYKVSDPWGEKFRKKFF